MSNIKKLVSKIEKALNPQLAKVDGYSTHGSDEIKILRIRTTNNYLITFINSQDKNFWIDTERDGAVIFDKNFSVIKNFFLKEEISLNKESYDSKNFVKTSLNLLKLLTLKKKTEAQKWLDKVYIFKLKKLLIISFNLQNNLHKDYFLFGNDEFQIRYYKDIQSLKTIHDRLVKISDKSAIIFYENGKMKNIDLSSGLSWMTKTKFYPSVRPKTESGTEADHNWVTISKEENTTKYLKDIPPTKEELKGQKFIKIKNAQGMVFKLLKINGKFKLQDPKTKDILEIPHPDLLITLV